SRGFHGEAPDALPVLGRAHRVARAPAMAVWPHLVGLDAAPILHCIAAAGRDLEEVRVVSLVEAQGGLRERGAVAIDVGEVTPERVRRAIRRLAPYRRLDALELGHAASIQASSAVCRSRVVARSRTVRGGASPSAAPPSTRSRDGMGTMPVKRPPSRRTGVAAPRGACPSAADTVSASVAVPCRMMAGSPARRATSGSVWIGFQIRAHSE